MYQMFLKNKSPEEINLYKLNIINDLHNFIFKNCSYNPQDDNISCNLTYQDIKNFIINKTKVSKHNKDFDKLKKKLIKHIRSGKENIKKDKDICIGYIYFLDMLLNILSDENKSRFTQTEMNNLRFYNIYSNDLEIEGYDKDNNYYKALKLKKPKQILISKSTKGDKYLFKSFLKYFFPQYKFDIENEDFEIGQPHQIIRNIQSNSNNIKVSFFKNKKAPIVTLEEMILITIYHLEKKYGVSGGIKWKDILLEMQKISNYIAIGQQPTIKSYNAFLRDSENIRKEGNYAFSIKNNIDNDLKYKLEYYYEELNKKKDLMLST